MARLPEPGKDVGTWGVILNDFLNQSHKADGSIKDNAVTSASIAGNIPQTKIENLQTDLSNKADTSTLAPVATSGVYADLTDKPTIPSALSDLSDDSTHRLVTDTEKNTWNAKQDAGAYLVANDIAGKEDSSNKENTVLDTSTSKYPTNRLVKEYADTKAPALGPDDNYMTNTEKAKLAGIADNAQAIQGEKGDKGDAGEVGPQGANSTAIYLAKNNQTFVDNNGAPIPVNTLNFQDTMAIDFNTATHTANVMYGDLSSTTFSTGALSLNIPSQMVSFAIKGRTTWVYSAPNSAWKYGTCSGKIRSLKADGSVLAEVSTPVLYGWDYMADGKKYTTSAADKYRMADGAPSMQVETATVVGTIGTAGNATVIVTAAGMTGTPKTISVAVANADTASVVAGKIRTALGADADVIAKFTVSGATDKVILTANANRANDSTLNISINNGTCTGLTAALTSANTTAGAVDTWTYESTYGSYWRWMGGITDPGSSIPAHIYSDILPVVSWDTFRLSSTTDAFAYNPAGKIHFKVSGKTSQALYDAWRIANVNSVYSVRTTGTQTGPVATTTTIQVENGGSLVWVPDDTVAITSSLLPGSLVFTGNIKVTKSDGIGEKKYLSVSPGDTVTSAVEGYANFTIVGNATTTVVTNPWTLASNDPKAIPTLGILKSFVGVTEMSSYTIPPLYGNLQIQDNVTELSQTKCFSDKAYFKSSWTWTSTLSGSVGTGARKWTTLLSESDFAVVPYKNTSSEPSQIISDCAAVITGDAMAALTVGSLKESFYWDSNQNKYVLTIAAADSHIPDLATLVGQVCGTWKLGFYYRYAVPVTKGLVNKLISLPNVIFNWALTSGYTAASSITINVPTNIYSAISQKAVLTNLNDLNYAVQNIKINEASLGVPDGSTDNLVAFQDEIAKASVGSKVVNLPSGNYVVSSSLSIPAGITVIGTGNTNIIFTNPNNHGFIITGSKTTLRNINIKMPISTSLVGGVYIDGAGSPSFITLDSIKITGGIVENKVKAISDARGYTGSDTDQTCGILARSNGGYVYNLKVSKCGAYNINCGIDNQATPSTVEIDFDYVVYGIKASALYGSYTYTGHNRSMSNFRPLNDPLRAQIILSKANVYCSGKFNTFTGHAYDNQRTLYTYYFDTNSSYNTYDGLSGADVSNYDYMPNMWYDSYGEEVVGTDHSLEYFPYQFNVVYDLGSNNRSTLDIFAHGEDPVVGGLLLPPGLPDVAGTVKSTTKYYGMQDNAFANFHKWGTLTCNSGTVTGTIDDVFSVDGGSELHRGFASGVTFVNVPSASSPITIIMDMSARPVSSQTKWGIQWNTFMPKKFKVYYSNDGTNWTTVSDIANNTQLNWWYREKIVPVTLTYIKIEIIEGYQTNDINPLAKVGISHIWCHGGGHGGRAFLSQGGGQVYGDLDMNTSYLKIGAVTALPVASVAYRSKTICLLGDATHADALYICLKQADNTYAWVLK